MKILGITTSSPLKRNFVREIEKSRKENETETYNVHQTTNRERSSLIRTISDLKDFNNGKVLFLNTWS